MIISALLKGRSALNLEFFSDLSSKHIRLNVKRDIQLEFTLGWKVRGLNYERK